MNKSLRIGPSPSKQRLGGWLPDEESAVAQFRQRLAREAKSRPQNHVFAPVVQELERLVGDDAVLRMALSRAINDCQSAGFVLGYKSIHELMAMIDAMLCHAPSFSESSLIHCPLNAVLDWPMGMPTGYEVFRDPAFNAQLKRVLNHWSGFLSGPHSREHLTTDNRDGWLSPAADKHIGLSQFVCNLELPYGGFASWNDFFTRRFREDMRPVESPNESSCVVSACEATTYNIQRNVKLQDAFWIKSQHHSLLDVFTPRHRELAQRFVGGTVYQAFLSAFNYHRWHAPVSGTVRSAYVIDGTYYSTTEAEGTEAAALNDSQGYITAVATRAIIEIESDEKSVGTVGCVFVGMAEVSSCVIDVYPGQTVQKGDELGFFQYGGSTWCLVFEPHARPAFSPRSRSKPTHVNTRLATIT